MKLSQRETVLKAIAPGDLVYAYVPIHYAGIYEVDYLTRFGPALLGVAAIVPRWSEIGPPF